MKSDKNYFLLCIIALLQGFVFYGPIATVYRQVRGISIYEIFLIESIFMVLMIVFEIPWGTFADRFGYKVTFVSALTISFISKLVFYWASSFEAFLMERVLLALSISGMSGCDTALLYNSIEEKNSEKAFGRYYSMTVLGFLFATSVSSFIIAVSMELTALLTIVFYGISVLVALFLKEVKAKNEKAFSVAKSLKMVLENRRILIFILAVAIASEASHSVTTFLNQVQYQRSGIDIKYYGFILAAIQLVTMLSARIYIITGRLGQHRTVSLIYAAIAAGCIALSLTANPVISIMLVAFVSLGSASVTPISSDIQNKSIKTANRATMLSAYAMVVDMVSAAVNMGIGRAADYSLQAAFILNSILCIAALVLNEYYFRKQKAIE